jgi:hypothetical protein
MAKTISFDEKTNTWTSFWGYHPDWMTRLNRGFFSFKKGQLYRHHSETSSRNYFYNDSGVLGIQPSFITVSFNQDPSDIKHFKTISLESNTNKWDATIETNLDNGHISYSNFDTREGEHYGMISRNNSSILDFTHLSIQGIGEAIEVDGNGFTFDSVPSFLSTDDTLYTLDEELGNPLIIGRVSNFNSTVVEVVNPPINAGMVGGFYFVAKSPAAESNGIKGNHAKLTLTTVDSGVEATLFAVNTEIFKSFQ